ncbi:MAG: glutathione S-transferase family protein [bacterium]|nr:glutathione S-transferase family protein [bacterium]
MGSEPRLYAFPGSLCSQKVRLALAEKRVSYEKHFVDIELRLVNYEPWYLQLNPKGVVPTLVHGDTIVTDSARIIRYIDEAFEGPALIPEGAYERECMEQWIEQQDLIHMRELSYATFGGALGLLLRRVSLPLRMRKLHRLRNRNPDLAELYEAKIQDVHRWRASLASVPEINEIRNHLAEVLQRVEDQLEKTRYLAGNSYSLADVVWTCVLARLTMLGLAPSLWGDGQAPHLKNYYEQLRLRPSFDLADIWEVTPSPSAQLAMLRSVISGSRTDGPPT